MNGEKTWNVTFHNEDVAETTKNEAKNDESMSKKGNVVKKNKKKVTEKKTCGTCKYNVHTDDESDADFCAIRDLYYFTKPNKKACNEYDAECEHTQQKTTGHSLMFPLG